MSENILQTAQHLVQDVLSPDIRELKANQVTLEKQIAALEKHMDIRLNAAEEKNKARFDAVDARFDAIDARFSAAEEKNKARFDAIDARLDAMEKKTDAHLSILLAAISESRAQAELTSVRVIAQLSERVAVLEAQRH